MFARRQQDKSRAIGHFLRRGVRRPAGGCRACRRGVALAGKRDGPQGQGLRDFKGRVDSSCDCLHRFRLITPQGNGLFQEFSGPASPGPPGSIKWQAKPADKPTEAPELRGLAGRKAPRRLIAMYPDYAVRNILPYVMYALAVSLFALLLLNLSFPAKRRRNSRRHLKK